WRSEQRVPRQTIGGGNTIAQDCGKVKGEVKRKAGGEFGGPPARGWPTPKDEIALRPTVKYTVKTQKSNELRRNPSLFWASPPRDRHPA
ncbi:MAG: hypothetical protein IKC53_01575, partial [Lentisphaeria bacterium]|nr:hypothetical protein [Lentisphaeria bacterium]